MTKISRYVIDDKVTGSDKWIGSDAQTQYTTKNFTPTKLAVYFNENQVIDIGTPIRYRYDILEFGDTRLPGTITFNPQVGTPYNLSSISSFILSKYTLKGNDVTQYLNFLIGSNVLIYKADDINIFGLYKVVSLVENIAEPDFFDVVVSYTTGNGSIVEDKDYLVSLIDIPGGDIPTKTSDLINDGEDGVHPFITLEDITPQVNSDWDATSGVAEILNKPTKTSDFTNDGEDGVHPFITLEDIPIQNLQQVTDEGNITTNNIEFETGVGIVLDNNSKLKEGTIDAEYGGSKGIAQICAVGYELKWEAGRLYVMGDGGTTIREVSHNFTTIPTIYDDIDKGFIVGSRWILDNGDLYVCLDNSDDTAVWELQGFVPYTGATQDVNLGEFDITAAHLIKDGGVSTQFLKADGSVDNNVYLTSADLPSTLDLYATTTASDVSGYTVLVRNISDSRFNTTAVNVSTGAITTINQLVGSLVSDANTISGNPGIFNFTTIGNIRRISGSGEATFYFRIYKRDSLGVETFITQSDNTIPVIDGSIYVEFSAVALWNDGIFLDTDRIVLKYYANRISGGSNPTYQFQFGGISPVRSTASIPVAVLPNIYLRDLADVENVDALNNEVLYWNDADSLWEHSLVTDLPNVGTVKSVAALTLGTTGTDLTSTVANGTTTPAITLNVPTASATNRGALSSTDWTAFNGKFNLPSLTSGSVLFSNGTTIAQDNANFFWDDTNNRLGIGTTTPTARLHVAAPGALSTDIALRVRNSANTGDLFQVLGNGAIVLSSGASFYTLGNNLNFRSNLSGGSGYVIDAQSFNSLNSTSNEQGFGMFSGTFAPTSGTGTLNGLKITPTINQTGGANGVTRGLYINPTLTAAADFRAIETTIGKVVLNSTSGNTLIGTTTDIASSKLTVNSTTQGFLPPRMTNAQRIAIATPAVGLCVYCTDVVEGLYINKSTGWTYIG